MNVETTIEITKDQLIKAMCTRNEPCVGHKEAAEKLWAKLERFYG